MVLDPQLGPAALRPRLVARERLFARLDQAHHHPLTLIAAPAGYGKTTLVADWLSSRKASASTASLTPSDGCPAPTSGVTLHAELSTSVAWLTLDPDDNDPRHYLASLAAALAPALPDWLPGDTVPAPETLLAALTAPRVRPLLLVLDDYHALTNPQSQRILARLLDHPPAGLRLIVTARGVPPALPLARLRARGQLLELTAADLRFTPEECARFLREVMDLAVTADQVQALADRTEGWAAALQLAALSLQGRAEPAAFVAGFGGRHAQLAEYLAGEVFARQPVEVQDFLLRTAHLDRLCAPLCEAVTGQPGAQARLDHIERARLFLFPLDDERCWFRYHALFAGFLRERAAGLEEACRRDLHRRAGRWLQAQPDPAPALGHLLAAGEQVAAADLVDRCARDWMRRGELHTLLAQLQKVPHALRASRLNLCVWQAWACALTGSPHAAAEWLDQVEALVARARPPGAVDDLALPPQLRTAIGQAVAIRGVLARQRGEAAAALPLAARALALLPESEGPLRAIVTAHLGLAQMQSGAADQADAAFEEAVRAARRGGDGFLLNSSLCLQAGQHLERGRPHAARRLYIEALARAEAAGLPGLTLLPRTRLAWLHYHWNELDAAETHLDAALRVALPDVPAAALVHVHLVRARARQARGDAAGADEALAAAERLTADHHLPQMTALVLAWQARLWLLRGEVAAAGRWAETAGLWRLQSSTGWDAPRDLPADLALTTGCLWLIARAEPESLALAGDLLEARLRPADPASLPLAALEYWRLRALLAQARGHTPEAAAALGEALALAEPMGFLRLFLDDGPALRPALAQLAGRRSRQTLAHRLLALLPPGASPLADPLNPHELAILRLLARGHSNADIARERVLAVSTVRWYLKHIYQKLGVHNRTQAADRARQLNLL